jgi:hypothetical protein
VVVERAGQHDPRMPLAVAAVLDAVLQDDAGAPTTLRAHLGPRALVVVFLRHFG